MEIATNILNTNDSQSFLSLHFQQLDGQGGPAQRRSIHYNSDWF